MATASQITANQQNAQASTGPRTAEGKSRSAANATRHGLAGSFAVLAHESLDEFEQLRTGLLEKFQPQDANEQFLVTQMVHAAWRLNRIERLESRNFELCVEFGRLEPGAPTDDDTRILTTMATGAGLLDAFNRYRAAAERSYYKALQTLLSGRASQTKQDAAEARLETAELKRQSAAAIKAFDEMLYAPMPVLQNEPNFRQPAQSEFAPPASVLRQNLRKG